MTGSFSGNRAVPAEVDAILQGQMENFYRWLNYKDCMTSVESLKQAIVERLFTLKEMNDGLSEAEIIALSVDKTVDLMVTGWPNESIPSSWPSVKARSACTPPGARLFSKGGCL